jgi:hypothetical protein
VKKPRITLVGPFIGELFWELFRFAPYIISLKKEKPAKLIAVFTRPERFDLYGRYANFLIPLRIKEDSIKNQDCFRLIDFRKELYYSMVMLFQDKYRKEYVIEDHFYPDVGWRYNLKWQFPRDKMDYDFKPRKENDDIVEEIVRDLEKIVLIDKLDTRNIDFLHSKGYTSINIKTIPNFCIPKHNDISFIGCIIELMKRCEFVISNTTTILGRLSLLLKKPLITIDEKIDYDSLSLVNPLKTKVIVCNKLEKGLVHYENNLRS